METRIREIEYVSGRKEYVCEKREPKKWWRIFPKLTKDFGWSIITFKWGYGACAFDRKAKFETKEQAKQCVADFIENHWRKEKKSHHLKIKNTTILKP